MYHDSRHSCNKPFLDRRTTPASESQWEVRRRRKNRTMTQSLCHNRWEIEVPIYAIAQDDQRLFGMRSRYCSRATSNELLYPQLPPHQSRRAQNEVIVELLTISLRLENSNLKQWQQFVLILKKNSNRFLFITKFIPVDREKKLL